MFKGDALRRSSEELVKIIVGTDPESDDGVAVAFGKGSDGPNALVARHLLEAKRRGGAGFSAKS